MVRKICWGKQKHNTNMTMGYGCGHIYLSLYDLDLEILTEEVGLDEVFEGYG